MRLFCFLLFLGLTVACQPKPTTDEAANPVAPATRKTIEAQTSRFTQAHIAGDTAFLNNIFTDDARVMAPNANPISGRRAIAAINLEYVNYGIREFRETTTALYGSGDYVMDEGTYVMRYGKDNTTETGKYLNVWKKVDDDWKIYANIWNTNAPNP